MIQVTASRKLRTSSLASSLVQFVANASPTTPRSTLGYRDFKILRVRLDALSMFECITYRDQVGSRSSISGARLTVFESCG
jgi:hypothetical protein